MAQTLTTFYGKNQNAETLTAKIKHVLNTETNILITHLSKTYLKTYLNNLMLNYQSQASLVIILPILKLILMFTNKKTLSVKS